KAKANPGRITERRAFFAPTPRSADTPKLQTTAQTSRWSISTGLLSREATARHRPQLRPTSSQQSTPLDLARRASLRTQASQETRFPLRKIVGQGVTWRNSLLHSLTPDL